MASATLTSKGQVTIPKEIRDLLGIAPGDKLDFAVESNGRVVLHPVTLDVRQLRGLLKSKGLEPVTLDPLEKAIAEAASPGRK